MKSQGGIQKQPAEKVEEKAVEKLMEEAISLASKLAVQEGAEQVMERGFVKTRISSSGSAITGAFSLIYHPRYV